MRKIDRPFFQPFLYPFTKNLARLLFVLGWGARVIGRENVPKEGGVIFAANHRSYADPPLVGSALHRQVHFLAKEELFSFKPFGWYISNLNAHPLNRNGGDVSALRAAKKLLEAGYPMIVFPEGSRSKTDELRKPKPGVGLLAKMANVKVVPVYVHNSGHMAQFKRVAIQFAPPIDPSEYKTHQEIAERVMADIQKMKEAFR